MKESIWSKDITHEVVTILAVFALVVSSVVTTLGVATLGVQAQIAFAQSATGVSQTAAVAGSQTPPPPITAADLLGIPAALDEAGIAQDSIPTVDVPAAATAPAVSAETTAVQYVPLYRYYNSSKGDHADYTQGSKSGWSQELTLGYLSPVAGSDTVALHRCMYTLPGIGSTHATVPGSSCPTNPALPSNVTITDEGVIGYAWATADTGRVGIYSCRTSNFDIFSNRIASCGGLTVLNNGVPAFYLSTTAAPKPVLDISATPGEVVPSGTSVVEWEGQNVSTCTITQNNVPFATGLKGKKTSSALTSTTTYALACAKLDTGTTTSKVSVSVNSNPDITAPTVLFSSPQNNRKVTGSVYISLTANDPQGRKGQSVTGVDNITLLVNGSQVAELTKAPYAYVWNTATIATGTYTITAVAQDKAGNKATAVRTVVVQHLPPVMSLVALYRFNYDYGYFSDHLDLALDKVPDTKHNYVKEGTLGYVSNIPGPGLAPLYECEWDYNTDLGLAETFTSKSSTCEGKKVLASPLGYVWTKSDAVPNLKPLYRCLRTTTVSFYWGFVHVTFEDHYSTALPLVQTYIAGQGLVNSCSGGGAYEGTLGYVSTVSALTPSLSLARNPENVVSGAASTVTWSAVNASGCTLTTGTTTLATAAAGTISTGPLTKDTSYKLTCTKTNGASISTSATVAVRAADKAFVSVRAVNPTMSEGGDSATIKLTRRGDLTQALPVSFTASGTAVRNADYTLSGAGIAGASTIATIPAGTSTVFITVTPINDRLVEGTESINFVAKNGTGYEAVVEPAYIAVIDDETPLPTYPELDSYFSTTYRTHVADGLKGWYPVATGYGGLSSSVLGYLSSTQTADTQPVYSCSPKYSNNPEASYAAFGDCSSSFGFNAQYDKQLMGYAWSTPASNRQPLYLCPAYSSTDYDGNTTSSGPALTTTPACGGQDVSPQIYFYVQKTAVVVVPVSVSISATVSKALERGPVAGAFAIARTGDTSSALSVSLILTGTAQQGVDYKLSGGGISLGSSTSNVAGTVTVTIPRGQEQVVVSATPIQDSIVDAARSVVLSIASGVGYKVASTKSATVTIAADEAAPALSITAAPATLVAGQSATITWSAKNVDTCTVVTTGATIFAVGTSGHKATDPLNAKTTYNLNCLVNGRPSTSTSIVVPVVADKTLPTVSISAPVAAATVSGVVTVSATAKDNVEVVGVTFMEGTTAIGAEDTVAPYAIVWNTKALTNGTHQLSAVARDAAGNAAVTKVNVTVSNYTAPTLTITATPTSISAGAASTIAWSAANATNCTVSKGTAVVWSGQSGSQSTGALTANTDYTLRCVDQNAKAISKTVTVTVTAVATPSLTITANPVSVVKGGSSTITWSAQNVAECGIFQNTSTIPVGVGLSGSQNTGPLTTSTLYTLGCRTSGGATATSNVTVVVVNAQAAPAPVTYTISGVVWVDKNGDKVMQAAEKKLSGERVVLRDSTNIVVARATTDATGTYTFSGIAAGSYRIGHTVPAGYVKTTDDSSVITVSKDATYNFGVKLSNISIASNNSVQGYEGASNAAAVVDAVAQIGQGYQKLLQASLGLLGL